MAVLTYGLKDGKLVHIDTVENGNKCGCVCAKCEKPFIAKHDGKKNEHHFAHQPGIDCPGAVESTLHRLAKQVLCDIKKLKIPTFTHEGEEIPGREVFFDTVEAEKGLDSPQGKFTPDAIGTMKERPLLVEFAWTHFVEPEKMEKILSSSLPCLEIRLEGQELDEQKLKEFLVSDSNREWLCNPKLEEMCKKNKAQKEKARMEKEARELKEKRQKDQAMEAQLAEYKKRGYRIIGGYRFSEEIVCPKNIEKLANLKESPMYKDPRIAQILDNPSVWDRAIGRHGRGGGKVAVIAGKPYDVFPSNNKCTTLSEDERKKYRLFFAQLSEIQKLYHVSCGDCKNCVEIFPDLNTAVCNYP